MCAALAVAAALMAALLPGHAEEARALRGVALVIGNSGYAHLPALANPANDARAVEMLLAALGFETELSSDRDARRLARDLDIFLEDAEGADVAVLYYAGHGIEAGGENFLVPVDADLSALDAAGEKLVPISAFLDRLQAVVPVTIIMLDACRDNPFPPGASVRLDPASEPAAMGEGGLGETRGAVRIAPAGVPAAENFGAVIAFSAAPGHVALDGEPGDNSPYTAAVLRHLETMAGEEFGTVMRMVAEEVYLKTAGRQRPWINESLRRLLYFGAAPEPTSGVEGEILAERRQLLITVSALPMQGRSLVERVSGERGVPMDALFAMLSTLGEDLPDDPAELDGLLRRLADDVKRALEERSALRSTDPEIMRLSQLAETATAEGALTTAVSLYEQAKARIGELAPAVEAAEEAARARRIEFAGIYAGSAAARALALDHLGAAEDFAQAAGEVARWDEALNRRYRLAQARALIDHGVIRGDTPALEAAVGVLDALAREAGDAQGGEVRLILADALFELGRRQTVNETLERAVATYRDLLEGAAELDRAAATRRLGAALFALGRRDIGAGRLNEATAALEAALELVSRADAPLQWAAVQVDLGQVLAELWDRDRDGDALDRAIERYRAALEALDADAAPAAFASAQLGLGKALRLAGIASVRGSLPGRYFGFFAASASTETREAAALFRQSDAAFDAALEACGRETYPVCWAAAQHGRAAALYSLGSVELDDRDAAFGHFRRSLAAFEGALSEQRFDMSPLDWAETHASRAEMLQRFALRSAVGIDLIYLAEAAKGYGEALAVISPQSLPAMWFDLSNRLAEVYGQMASRDGREGRPATHARRKVEQLRAALLAVDPQEDPERWAGQRLDIADNLRSLGELVTAVEPVEEAIAIVSELGDTSLRAGYTRTLGQILLALSERDDDPELERAARQAHEDAVSIASETGDPEMRGRYVQYLGQFMLTLAERHDDPRLARAARHALEEAWVDYYRNQPSGIGDRPLQRRLSQADGALERFETARLEEVAAGYRAALTPEARAGDPDRWALDQYDLAAVLKALAQGTDEAALLDEAAAAYRAALDIWTLEAEALRHGLAQELLGDTLRLAAEKAGDAPDLMEEAVAAYEAALDGLSPERALRDHVHLRRAVARMLADTIGKPRRDNEALERAVAHYRAVLDVWTVEDDPFDVIKTLEDIGDVSRELARNGAGSRHIAAAADAYRAVSAIVRDKLDGLEPVWWREHEQKIAHALLHLGEAEGDMGHVREALGHYEAALAAAAEVADGQVEEAFLRSNHARALLVLGSTEADAGTLERSVAEMRQSMAVLDRDAYPDSWAWSSERLGLALLALAEADAGRAGEAMAAFRAVLELRPRETHPWIWAAATNNLARAMVLDAGMRGDAADLEQAVALSRAAAPVFQDAGSAHMVALTDKVQCEGLTGLARARGDAAPALAAVDACGRALPVLLEHGGAPEQEQVRAAHAAALAALAELQGEGMRQ